MGAAVVEPQVRAQKRLAQPLDPHLTDTVSAPHHVDPAAELVIHIDEIRANPIERGVNAGRQGELPELAEPKRPLFRVHTERASDAHVPAHTASLLETA